MSAQTNPFGHRSVRCKKHGVAYNPDKYSGCPICRRVARKPQQQQSSSGPSFLLTASIFAMAVSLLMMIAGSPGANAGSAEEGTAGEIVLPEEVLVDPSPFRGEIQALEAVLYQPRPAGPDDPPILGDAMDDLGVALEDQGVGETLSTRLRALAADFTSSHYDLDLISRRTDWERMREAGFVNVAWFQKSNADLDRAQTPASFEPAEVKEERIETLLAGLEIFISEVGPEALEFAAQGPAPPPAATVDEEGEETASPLQIWSRSWKERLDTVAADRPSAPDRLTEPELHRAHDRMRMAIEQLRMVPVEAGYGAADAVQNRFDRAQTAIDEARQQLLPPSEEVESSTAA